jgi:hypothetical protein
MKIEKLKFVERFIHGISTQVLSLTDEEEVAKINSLIERENDNQLIKNDIMCNLEYAVTDLERVLRTLKYLIKEYK